MKKVIGITGGVGSGKSSVVDLIKEKYGADVMAADTIAAGLEEPGGAAYEPLISAFGKDILDDDGRLDRRAFSDLIFSDPAALELVNSIVHPLTIEEIRRRIKDSGASLIIIEAAVFPEGLTELCDEVWFVDADEEIRKSRLMSGRGYTVEKCDEIMKNQDSREEFLKISSRVIDNSSSLDKTKSEIISILGDPAAYLKRDAL